MTGGKWHETRTVEKDKEGNCLFGIENEMTRILQVK